jgi:hypothetical protein
LLKTVGTPFARRASQSNQSNWASRASQSSRANRASQSNRASRRKLPAGVEGTAVDPETIRVGGHLTKKVENPLAREKTSLAEDCTQCDHIGGTGVAGLDGE